MSTDKGYIRLYRSVRDHWIWGDPEMLRAWIDILMMVNHKDNKTLFDGSLMVVKRGSKVTSLRKLSIRWGWSKDKTSRFLNMLESDGMISQRRDSKKTLINVINYGFYQSSKPPRETVKRQSRDTDKDTDKDTERNKQRMIKNVGKNEEKKEIIEEDKTDDELRAEGWTVW